MDDQLLALLDHVGVLSALGTTRDGLVVGAAGLSGDDAEIVGAAGSTLWSAVENAGEASGSTDVGSASIHLLRGAEISLVILTEADVVHQALVPVMENSLEAVTSVFS